MSHPPVFDRYTLEDQQDLLDSADRWEKSKSGWKLFLQFAGGAVLLVGGVILLLVGFGTRF